MKRKRWLAMALVFCLLGTTVPLTALAAGEDGEVQYIVSNDGTTLTIQGDGEITSQALDANVTEKDTHFCGDWRRRYRDCRWLQLGISRGCNQRYPEGIGGVPIWQVFF